MSELVRCEDRFMEVEDALKHLCKADIDKLILAVRTTFSFSLFLKAQAGSERAP
jgi:hypothetical protein